MTCGNCAPRRNRTYNPLVAAHVIRQPLAISLMLGQSASDPNVSVDQRGRSITRTTEEIDDVILDAVRLADPGDGVDLLGSPTLRLCALCSACRAQ